MSTPRSPSPRPHLAWRVGLPVLLLFFLGAGCTLEPRFDPDRDDGEALDSGSPATMSVEEGAAGEDLPPGALGAVPPEEGVRATLDVFREAVRVGDLSLALSLLHREAIIRDELAGEAGFGATRGEVLMELRRRHADGLRLQVEEEDVRELEGAWLATSHWTLLWLAGDEAPEAAGTAWESALVVPSPEGWRIALFHRSYQSIP